MVEIRVGYELIYDCPQPTPMMLVLNIHYTRASDILVPDHVKTDTVPSNLPMSVELLPPATKRRRDYRGAVWCNLPCAT